MRLRINPIACVGHGLCAELLPELVELDEWGYPILSPEAVPPHLLPHARRAVSLCPTLALLFDRKGGGGRSSSRAADGRLMRGTRSRAGRARTP